MALSGMRFFYLTRDTILKVISFYLRLRRFLKQKISSFQTLTTIVSYELVMLTFNEASKATEAPAEDVCSNQP